MSSQSDSLPALRDDSIEAFLDELRPEALAVTRSVLARCGCEAYAPEDAVQDAFLRIARIPGLVMNPSARAYALKAVRNTAIDHLRSHQSRVELLPSSTGKPDIDRQSSPAAEQVDDSPDALARLVLALAWARHGNPIQPSDERWRSKKCSTKPLRPVHCF